MLYALKTDLITFLKFASFYFIFHIADRPSEKDIKSNCTEMNKNLIKCH